MSSFCIIEFLDYLFKYSIIKYYIPFQGMLLKVTCIKKLKPTNKKPPQFSIFTLKSHLPTRKIEIFLKTKNTLYFEILY